MFINIFTESKPQQSLVHTYTKCIIYCYFNPRSLEGDCRGGWGVNLRLLGLKVTVYNSLQEKKNIFGFKFLFIYLFIYLSYLFIILLQISVTSVTTEKNILQCKHITREKT